MNRASSCSCRPPNRSGRCSSSRRATSRASRRRRSGPGAWPRGRSSPPSPCSGLALVISPNRATTMMAGGVGVVVTAGLTLFAIWGGRRVVLGRSTARNPGRGGAVSSAATDDLPHVDHRDPDHRRRPGRGRRGGGGDEADGVVRPLGRGLRRSGPAREPQLRRAPQPTAARPQPAARAAVRRGDTIDVTPGAWDAYSGRVPSPSPAAAPTGGTPTGGMRTAGTCVRPGRVRARAGLGCVRPGCVRAGRHRGPPRSVRPDPRGVPAPTSGAPPRDAPPRPLPHDDGGPPTRLHRGRPHPSRSPWPTRARPDGRVGRARRGARRRRDQPPAAGTPPAHRPAGPAAAVDGTVGADQIMRDRQRRAVTTRATRRLGWRRTVPARTGCAEPASQPAVRRERAR